MPNIVATRPAAGQAIQTAWGQEVHDAIESLQYGTASVVVSGASSGTVVVTFPRAYATAPLVLVTLQSVGSNTQAHTWIATAGATTTQVTIAAGRDDGTTFSGTLVVAWLALGTLA
jgi:hypothetical protein